MIGLKRGTVTLKKHSPTWVRAYQTEEKKLRKVFDKEVIAIEHVGSTSIAGLPAKPIIDIGVAVRSLKGVERLMPRLKSIGYKFKKEELPKQIFFAKGPESKRTHYLHVTKTGSRFWKEMILFRDYLRKNKKATKEYVELKSELAVAFKSDREKYTKSKANFIKSIIKKAKAK